MGVLLMFDNIDYGFNRLYAFIMIGIWLSTTLIFLWSVRRNTYLNRDSKNMWSFIIIFFWVVGMLLFLAWESNNKKPSITDKSH